MLDYRRESPAPRTHGIGDIPEDFLVHGRFELRSTRADGLIENMPGPQPESPVNERADHTNLATPTLLLDYAATREAFLRSCSCRKRLRMRMVFGVISTSSSSAMNSMADSSVS